MSAPGKPGACEAGGDLEARSHPVPGSEGDPELVALHDAVNRVLVGVPGCGGHRHQGLSQMAERLRSEATGFLGEMRR
jgi:hypothetical protein